MTAISSDMRWFFRGSFVTVTLKSISMLVSLAFVSVLSFVMPQSQYGLFAMVISTVLFGAAIGSVGQYDLLVRDLAGASLRSTSEQANEFVETSTRWAFHGGVVSALITGVILYVLGVGVPLTIAAAFLTILLSISHAWSGASRAGGRAFWSLAPREIMWRLTALAILPVLPMFALHNTAAAVSILALVALAVVLYLQARILGFRFRWCFSESGFGEKKPRLKASLDFMLGQVSAIGLTTIDIVIVGLFISEAAAAVYFPANRLALAASMVTYSIFLVISPRISADYKSGRIESIHRLSTIATVSAVVFGTIIGVGFWVGYPAVSSLFATATHETALALTVLVAAQIIQSAFGFGNAILAMTGHERTVRNIDLWALVLGTAAMLGAALFGSIFAIACARGAVVIGRKIVITIVTYSLTGILPISLGGLHGRKVNA